LDLATVTRELLRHRALLAVAVIAGLFAAFTTQYKLEGFPPKASKKALEYGAGSTQLMIDAPKTPVVDLGREFDPFISRATIFSKLMTSQPVVDVITREAGLPRGSVFASTPASGNQTKAAKEPEAEERSNAILGETIGYRLLIRAEPGQPLITISAQAPTPREAVRLADAGAKGFQKYVADLESKQRVESQNRVEIRQLGTASGGIVNKGASRDAAVLAFGAVFVGTCLLILLVANIRRGWRAQEAREFLAQADWNPDAPTNGQGWHAPQQEQQRTGDRSNANV
jgi:hypothetical protein